MGQKLPGGGLFPLFWAYGGFYGGKVGKSRAVMRSGGSNPSSPATFYRPLSDVDSGLSFCPESLILCGFRPLFGSVCIRPVLVGVHTGFHAPGGFYGGFRGGRFRTIRAPLTVSRNCIKINAGQTAETEPYDHSVKPGSTHRNVKSGSKSRWERLET